MLKHFALACAIALALYVVAYSSIEHRRTRLGPWQVTFTAETNGIPVLIINQPNVGITNVRIRFTHAEVPPTNATWVFAEARPVPFDLPFGLCRFQDTTFLPGTVAMEMFGHEIQLVPRTLSIDRREHRWPSGEVVTLTEPLLLSTPP